MRMEMNIKYHGNKEVITMENTYSIYKFTFSDGKVYIGQTSGLVEDRWKGGEGYKGQDVYVPIILDGWENVQKEILHTDLTSEQADKLEKHYIQKYNSRANGYNRTDGGKSGDEIPIKNNLMEIRKHFIKPIIAKIPNYGDPVDHGIFALPRILCGSGFFKEKILYEEYPNKISLVTYDEAAQCRDVYCGGKGHYTYSYLADWRCFSNDTTKEEIANTPWLTIEEVQPYNSTFFRDQKAKRYYKKYNKIPTNQDKNFKNFDYNTNKYR